MAQHCFGVAGLRREIVFGQLWRASQLVMATAAACLVRAFVCVFSGGHAPFVQVEAESGTLFL